MAQDINLLPDQTGEDKQKLRQRQLINRVSAIVLAITIVTVLGLFATNWVLQAQQDAVEKDIATQTQRIQAKKVDEGVYRSLDSKLTGLSAFFASQKHYSTFLQQFAKTMPDSLTLTDLTVTAADQATIAGKVSTYADLAGFYDKLRSAGPSQSTPYFTKPVLTSISRDDQSGVINFSMTFTLSPQVLAGAIS